MTILKKSEHKFEEQDRQFQELKQIPANLKNKLPIYFILKERISHNA